MSEVNSEMNFDYPEEYVDKISEFPLTLPLLMEDGRIYLPSTLLRMWTSEGEDQRMIVQSAYTRQYMLINKAIIDYELQNRVEKHFRDTKQDMDKFDQDRKHQMKIFTEQLMPKMKFIHNSFLPISNDNFTPLATQSPVFIAIMSRYLELTEGSTYNSVISQMSLNTFKRDLNYYKGFLRVPKDLASKAPLPCLISDQILTRIVFRDVETHNIYEHLLENEKLRNRIQRRVPDSSRYLDLCNYLTNQISIPKDDPELLYEVAPKFMKWFKAQIPEQNESFAEFLESVNLLDHILHSGLENEKQMCLTQARFYDSRIGDLDDCYECSTYLLTQFDSFRNQILSYPLTPQTFQIRLVAIIQARLWYFQNLSEIDIDAITNQSQGVLKTYIDEYDAQPMHKRKRRTFTSSFGMPEEPRNIRRRLESEFEALDQYQQRQDQQQRQQQQQLHPPLRQAFEIPRNVRRRLEPEIEANEQRQRPIPRSPEQIRQQVQFPQNQVNPSSYASTLPSGNPGRRLNIRPQFD